MYSYKKILNNVYTVKVMTSFPFQNPLLPAPVEVLKKLRTINVAHYTFTGDVVTGEIIMHAEVMNDVKDFFEYAFTIQFPIFSVIPIHENPFYFNDTLSCIANNSSGFNYRMIYNSHTLSKHSFGKAFDINPFQNIYITYDSTGRETYRLPKNGVYDPNAPGTLHADHSLVRFMKERGWNWGGDWTKNDGRTDFQHFEKMDY